MDYSWLEHLKTILIVLAAAAFILHFILVEYRSRRQSSAPVETARAVAYYKHPEMEASLAGRHSTYVYYITFHTESGDILKLYMDRDHYFSIPEGSWGMLTWQRDRFWKFEKEEG